MEHPCARPGTSFRRPAALALALVLAALLLAGLVPGAPARAADGGTTATPLTVRLAELTPAAIPTKGTLVLAGTVTNTSDETWISVNVHPFIARTPMTTRDELAAAAASEPTADVGERLTEVGQFAPIGDIQPAQTLSFRIELPVASLGVTQPGVYWIGVHALGQNTQGRDGIADGRARTFIPLVKRFPGQTSTSPVALVVPVREQVARDPRGRVLGASTWSEDLGPDGRLGRIAGFLSSAGPAPLSVLIDPAVLDAVSDLAAGNPAMSWGKPAQGPDDNPSESPSPSDTASPSRAGVRTETGDRERAASWLEAVTTAARRHVTLGLGYADPDVAALARQRSSLLALATRLSAETFEDQQIDAVPTVAPPGGWLPAGALARIATPTTVLLSDHSDRTGTADRTRWRTPSGQDLVLTDQQASSGGPAPTPPQDALAVRQRIISEAALRLADRPEDPMVVTLPSGWDPGPDWLSAGFFSALDQRWLKLVALAPSTDPQVPTLRTPLAYPAAQRKLEVTTPNLTAARTLSQTTTALSQLLQSDNDVAHDLAGTALNAVSVHARAERVESRVRVLATDAAVRRRIGKVEVLGTDFVTLSGGSGTLAVTLVNGLDQAVVVGVEPRTSTSDVTIAAAKPVKMAPGERTVLRLKAKASSIGVSRVVLNPVTSDGTRIGSPLVFSLRTSQVGKTIWFVLIGFGGLLVVMILRRVRRGIVEHRWKGRD